MMKEIKTINKTVEKLSDRLYEYSCSFCEEHQITVDKVSYTVRSFFAPEDGNATETASEKLMYLISGVKKMDTVNTANTLIGA